MCYTNLTVTYSNYLKILEKLSNKNHDQNLSLQLSQRRVITDQKLKNYNRLVV